VNTTRDTSPAPSSGKSILDEIPDREHVRTRLIASKRETAVLRSLLRVAEQAQKQRQATGRQVAHA
jgi:hypothetical protein